MLHILDKLEDKPKFILSDRNKKLIPFVHHPKPKKFYKNNDFFYTDLAKLCIIYFYEYISIL